MSLTSSRPWVGANRFNNKEKKKTHLVVATNIPTIKDRSFSNPMCLMSFEGAVVNGQIALCIKFSL